MKKILAISALFMGVLSSAPLALCAPQQSENDYSFIPAKYIENENDLRNLEMVCRKIGLVVSNLRNDSRKFSVNFENFEDYYQINNDKDAIVDYNETLKTLVYYIQPFNVEKINDILKLNDVKEDLGNTEAKIVIDPESKERTLRLCGKEWDCIIHPFDGTNYCVEYINHYCNFKYSPLKKRIMFFLSPVSIMNAFDGNIIKKYDEFVNTYGWGELTNINFNTVKNLTIPKSVKTIGDNAFRDCKSIEKVTISDGVKEIGENAFCGCESLKQINIPNSVTSIGKNAFNGCTSLEKITIPNSITSINWGTFGRCESLKEVKIPNSVKEICDHAFSGCTSLEEITIPDGVKCINIGILGACRSIKKINIPNSVEEICENAFWGAKSLEEINIPNSVKKIDPEVFRGNASLKAIKYKDNTYNSAKGFFEAFNKFNNPSYESSSDRSEL